MEKPVIGSAFRPVVSRPPPPVWLLVLAACIIAYFAQASIFTTVLGRTNFVQITVVAPQVIPQNAPTSVPPTATPGSSQ